MAASAIENDPYAAVATDPYEDLSTDRAPATAAGAAGVAPTVTVNTEPPKPEPPSGVATAGPDPYGEFSSEAPNPPAPPPTPAAEPGVGVDEGKGAAAGAPEPSVATWEPPAVPPAPAPIMAPPQPAPAAAAPANKARPWYDYPIHALEILGGAPTDINEADRKNAEIKAQLADAAARLGAAPNAREFAATAAEVGVPAAAGAAGLYFKAPPAATAAVVGLGAMAGRQLAHGIRGEQPRYVEDLANAATWSLTPGLPSGEVAVKPLTALNKPVQTLVLKLAARLGIGTAAGTTANVLYQGAANGKIDWQEAFKQGGQMGAFYLLFGAMEGADAYRATDQARQQIIRQAREQFGFTGTSWDELRDWARFRMAKPAGPAAPPGAPSTAPAESPGLPAPAGALPAPVEKLPIAAAVQPEGASGAPAAELAPVKAPAPPEPAKAPETAAPGLRQFPAGTSVEYLGEQFPVLEGIGKKVPRWRIKIPGETRAGAGRPMTADEIRAAGYQPPAVPAAQAEPVTAWEKAQRVHGGEELPEGTRAVAPEQAGAAIRELWHPAGEPIQGVPRQLIFGAVGADEAKAIQAATGVSIAGFRRVVDEQALQQLAADKESGATADVAARIPEVVQPGNLAWAGRDTQGDLELTFRKEVGDGAIVVTETRSSDGTLRVTGLRRLVAAGAPGEAPAPAPPAGASVFEAPSLSAGQWARFRTITDKWSDLRPTAGIAARIRRDGDVATLEVSIGEGAAKRIARATATLRGRRVLFVSDGDRELANHALRLLTKNVTAPIWPTPPKETPAPVASPAPAPAAGAASSGSAAVPVGAAGGQEAPIVPPSPAQVKSRGRPLSIGPAPNGEPDLLTDIATHVGTIRTKAKAGLGGGEFDDVAAALATGPARLLRGKTGMAPDQALEILNASGYSFGSTAELADAITKAANERQRLGRALKLEKYQEGVEAAALGNRGRPAELKAPGPVPVEELGLGAKFKIRGEPYSVVDADEGPHGEDLYVIQDGHRFMVPAGTMIYPDKGEFTAPAAPTEPVADPFAESVEKHAMGGGAPRSSGALVRQVRGTRELAAPQTMDGVARRVANLLRELNAHRSIIEDRAQAALLAYRNDFDRTPVLASWRYAEGEPLPRNYAVIDAYENGDVSGLSPRDQAFAAEIHRQNAALIERVHALGRGVLRRLIENYFPHLWKDPEAARNVILQSIAHRPLEGPKSFLKQRTYRLFRDGLTAKLTPVIDNPVDLWLAKLAEVEKFILGVAFQNTGREEGWIKFHYFGSAPVPGWRSPRDAAFNQWAPPLVPIQEAFDAGIRKRVLAFLAQMGVPHERLVRLAGGRWGEEENAIGVPGTERIRTRFAGPEFVIFHELGHALDSRYPGLRAALFGGEPREVAAARAARNFKRKPTDRQIELLKRDDELRALADARKEGVAASEHFSKYVRKTAEKMAAVLQAYMYAPDLMREKAPTIQRAMRDFIAAHPELHDIERIRPTMAIAEGEAEVRIPGLVKLGDWIMPDSAAQVVDNFLSPGLQSRAWYQILRGTSNLLNSVQLGMSAFHLGFTTLDATVSQLETALYEATRGDLAAAARLVATLPVAPVLTLTRGIRVRRSILDGTAPATTQALERAGGRLGIERFWVTNFERRLRRAIGQLRAQIAAGEWLGGVSSGLKAAVNAALWPLEKQMALIHWIVTRQKLGVFLTMAAGDIKRMGPRASAIAQQEVLRRAWDSVDNRMGRVVYDNFFFNRTLKDVALVAFRAFGWQLGKYAEAGGAIGDTIRFLGAAGRRVFKGDRTARPEWTHKMGYVVALPIVVGVIGAILHRLMTGRRPESARDCFQPRTGEIDQNGNPVRLNLPSYVKDAISYGRHPVTSFAHSLNPLWSATFDLLQNHDFYNVEIRHPDDPLVKQLGDVAIWAGRETVPFSVSGGLQLRRDAAPMWKQIAPFFGVAPVPSRERMTPAQELAAELMASSLPDEPMTQEQFDRGRAIKDIVRQIRAGPREAAQGLEVLRGGIDRETLNPNAAALVVERLRYTPLQFQVAHLTAPAALRVWDLATPAEKAEIGGIIVGHIVRSKSLPRSEKVRALQHLGLPPGAAAIAADNSARN